MMNYRDNEIIDRGIYSQIGDMIESKHCTIHKDQWNMMTNLLLGGATSPTLSAFAKYNINKMLMSHLFFLIAMQSSPKIINEELIHIKFKKYRCGQRGYNQWQNNSQKSS